MEERIARTANDVTRLKESIYETKRDIRASTIKLKELEEKVVVAQERLEKAINEYNKHLVRLKNN